MIRERTENRFCCLSSNCNEFEGHSGTLSVFSGYLLFKFVCMRFMLTILLMLKIPLMVTIPLFVNEEFLCFCDDSFEEHCKPLFILQVLRVTHSL